MSRRRSADVVDGVPSDEDVEKFVKRARRKRGLTARTWDAARREVEGMILSDEWSDATGRHLAALYAVQHARVYGVEAAELEADAERVRAVAAANRMLAADFGGDPSRFVEFLRWAWRRERGRHQWRVSTGREPTRMRWQVMFSRAVLTDWRVAIVREAGGG